MKLWRRPDGVRTPPTIQETSEGFLQKGKDKCKICSVYSIPKYYDLNVCGNGFSKKKLFSSLERERNFWNDKGVRTSGRHLDAFQNLRKFDDFFNDGRMWLKNCFCVCKMKILWSINVSKKFFVFKVPRLLKPQWNFWKDEDVRTSSGHLWNLGKLLPIFLRWEKVIP